MCEMLQIFWMDTRIIHSKNHSNSFFSEKAPESAPQSEVPLELQGLPHQEVELGHQCQLPQC